MAIKSMLGCITLTHSVRFWTKVNFNTALYSCSFQRCNAVYLYWVYFNKHKITTILLLQPLSKATAFLVATMWFAGTPSYEIFFITDLGCPFSPSCYICYLSSHIITPVHNGRLSTLPSQVYTPQILLFPISVNDGDKEHKNLSPFSNSWYWAQ